MPAARWPGQIGEGLQVVGPVPGLRTRVLFGRALLSAAMVSNSCASGKGSARPSSDARCCKVCNACTKAAGCTGEERQGRVATAVHNKHGLAKHQAHRSEGDRPRHAAKARTASYVCAHSPSCQGGLGVTRLRWEVRHRGSLRWWVQAAHAKQGWPQRQLIRGAGCVGQGRGELLGANRGSRPSRG